LGVLTYFVLLQIEYGNGRNENIFQSYQNVTFLAERYKNQVEITLKFYIENYSRKEFDLCLAKVDL
jgi:hypothetical protein